MSVIELFRSFSQLSQIRNFAGSARVLGYTLIYVWNEQRRPDVTIASRQRLMELTGLSESTFRWALKYLSDSAIIKKVSARSKFLVAFYWRIDCQDSAKSLRHDGLINTPASRVKSVEEKEKSSDKDFSVSEKEVKENGTRASQSIFTRQLPAGF